MFRTSLMDTKHLIKGAGIYLPNADLIGEIFERVDNLVIREGPDFARFVKPCEARDFLFPHGDKIAILCLSRDSNLPTPVRDCPKWPDYFRLPQGAILAQYPDAETTSQLIDWKVLSQALLTEEHFKDPICVAMPAHFYARPGTPEEAKKSALIDVAARLIVEHERTFYAAHLEMQKPKKIFLSHKSPDKKIVLEVAATLRALGFSPWVDEDAMPAGVKTERAIRQGFRDSCAAVFFVTPNFVDDGYLATEIDYAIQEKRDKDDRFAIITLQLHDASGSAGAVPSLLSTYKWKTPEPLAVIRTIVEALPIKCGMPNWRDGDPPSE